MGMIISGSDILRYGWITSEMPQAALRIPKLDEMRLSLPKTFLLGEKFVLSRLPRIKSDNAGAKEKILLWNAYRNMLQLLYEHIY
jgi:hypothetical protein